MPDKLVPNWYPINQLTLYEHLIDEMLDDTEIQYKNFQEAKSKPHVLNDELVGRALRLYSSQHDELWVLEEQIQRWYRETADIGTHQELDRLYNKLKRIKELSKSLLTILDYLKSRTIEQILAKDDMELAIDLLSGKLKL